VRTRGRERPLYAAIFALTLMWALHAVVDWDWELPVVTLWLFAAGGAALASPPGPFVVRLPPALRGGLVAGCVVLGLTPALVAVSQTRLVESVEAYEQGRCDDAAAAARSSISALGNRPEPYEILAYCNTRSGRYRQSMAMMGEAIERDPENWEYRYGLALVRAAAGRNPRRPLGQARKLNPRASILSLAEKRFRTRDPRRWRRAARDPRLSIP